MIGICRLENPIRTYDWGSRTALAEFLGQPVPAPEPQAELWLGAHPSAPSKLWIDGHRVPLGEAIAEHPEEILGTRVLARYGAELPYLFKVLAVERPLSLQAHPDRTQAVAGYRRETDAGIPRDQRSYPDAKPKPEIVYALTPFSMLRGFRPAAETRELVDRFGLTPLLPANAGIERFFAAWMALAPPRLDEVLATLLGRCGEVGGDVAAWIERLATAYPGDRGILAPLAMNLHRLAPGEAVFTGPRVLHAYLEGLGVELMLSSDNVVRGALTSKHRDLAELTRILSFEPDRPRPIDPDVDGGIRSFAADEADLELAVLELSERPIAGGRERGAEIVLSIDGIGTLTAAGGEPIELAAGSSFLIPAAVESYAVTGSGRLFRAGTRLTRSAP